MKIMCVAFNYPAHNKALEPTLLAQENPVMFMKPDSAILKNGKPFFIPDFARQFDYETELVVRINKMGKSVSERFAPRYYDAVTVGIDFTARDFQHELRSQGFPWDLSKGFDGSAILGDFVPLEEVGDINAQDFRLDINGTTVQRGNSRDMLFSIDRLISYVSRFCTLKTGDLLFTGTPTGTAPVHIDDHLEGYLGDRRVLSFNVK